MTQTIHVLYETEYSLRNGEKEIVDPWLVDKQGVGRKAVFDWYVPAAGTTLEYYYVASRSYVYRQACTRS
jgi:hypothetical protein